MIEIALKIIFRQTLQITVTAALLCGFVSAQKSKKPLSAEDYFRRGVSKAADVNKCEEAVKDFDKAIELNSRDARFYYKRGMCLSGDKRLADLNKAIELKPDFAEAYIWRGDIYQNRAFINKSDEDREKALNDFNKAIELNPKNALFYYARARFYFHYLKDYKKAFRDLDKAVALEPRDIDYLLIRAMYYEFNEEYEKAIADCAAALKIKPRDFDALFTRGRNYFSLGNYQKAINDYSAAIRAKPKYADQVYERRAEAYRAVGKISLAEADEKKNREMSKDTLVARDELRPKTLSDEELSDSYIFSSREKIKLIPDSEEKLKTLARQEIVRLTTLLEESPGFYARAFVMRANNYLKLGEYDKAIADYTEAIKYLEYDSFNYRGIAYARKGDYDAAIADFTKALTPEIAEVVKGLDLNLEQKNILYNRGLVLLNKGDFKLAVADLTSYIENDPNDVKPYQLRAKAYRKLGKIAEAEADEQRVGLSSQ